MTGDRTSTLLARERSRMVKVGLVLLVALFLAGVGRAQFGYSETVAWSLAVAITVVYAVLERALAEREDDED